MRRSLLALVALVPAAAVVATLLPVSAPAAPAKYPAGAVVYRPECFGNPNLDESYYPPPPTNGPTQGYWGGVVPATPPATSAPLPQPSPPVDPVDKEESQGSHGKPSLKLKVGGGKSASAPAAPASAPAPTPVAPAKAPAKVSDPAAANGVINVTGHKMAVPTDGDLAGGQVGAEIGGTVDTTSTSTDASKTQAGRGFESVVAEPIKDERSKLAEDKNDADRDDRAALEQPSNAQRGPVLDWGATVYLSNDDSMSLASAQRLLFATMNRLSYTVAQIRPHELLNYFSFDAVTPQADQMFDVLASAEQDGDHLSVALAVKGATPPRQDLDLTVVVDRSCSMSDDGKMDFTKRGLTLMSDQLRTGDRLDVVLFDDQVCVPLENYVVGRDDPKLLQQTIAQLQPLGSTDVGLGLRKAYDVAQAHLETHDRNRRVMIVTDAMMNTGDVDPNTVSNIGKAYDTQGIRLTGVGVGKEFDDKVLDMLTEKGKGAYVFLGSEAVVDRVFGGSGFDQLTQTIAHDVHFALKLPPSLAMQRFYGEEASTDIEEVQPVNYFAGTTQLFLQDLVVKNSKIVRTDPVQLQITYKNARTGEPETRTFKTTVGAMVDADPHNVRKGLALMSWSDFLTADAMGQNPCGAPLQTYAGRASKVSDDAEIGFVNGLVRNRCGSFELPAMVSNKGVPFKVRVDSDIPVSEVAISCAGQRSTEPLSGSDVIAMFTVTPGVCQLTLSGTVDMTAKVEVPKTGGDLRCLIRGGRLSCS